MPLPDDLKQQITQLYHSVGKYLYGSLAQWERGFLLDHDRFRRREVAVWHRIASAWQRYCENHGLTTVSAQQARKIIGALAGISMGCDPCDGPNPLDEATANELRDCFVSVR